MNFLLKFDGHISELCKKASRQLGVLKRIGRFLTKQGRMIIYKSFILSNFNYCPIVWHFCSKRSSQKMERIQERALRFVLDDYESSFTDLLCFTDSSLLHVNRLQLIAKEAYKILHKESPSYIQDLMHFKTQSYNSRRQMQAYQPHVNTTRYGLNSFRYEAPRIWKSSE